jgi:acyl phosphate:glycerol-3-phosphate acyltransferase
MYRIEYLIPVIAYLLGSIPFGYLLVRFIKREDIRTQGSGNIGATNVYRKSRWVGVLTLILDAAKGYVAVLAAARLGGDSGWQAAAAFAAVAGHTFPVWLGFKGGKGVATASGAFLAISPAAVGAALVVFLLALVLTRYVSLGSILAAIVCPIAIFLFHQPPAVLIWVVLGAALIVVRHSGNIQRLFSGTERRLAFGNRRKAVPEGDTHAN